jgi:CDP-glycerol glycerophosphotransferase (TagB/SpsB family)
MKRLHLHRLLLKKKNRNRIFFILRNFIDPWFTKNKNQIVLYSSTGMLDANLVCVKEYLVSYHPELKLVVLNGKVKRSLKASLQFLYAFFSSYYIIVDHAIPRFLTNKKRKIFNVWHGIPLKTIRHFDKNRFTDKFLDFESKNLSGLVCSSVLDQAVMTACFNIPLSKCILSGLPRADLLDEKGLDWLIDAQEKGLIEALNGRKLVSWMPTYRGTWKQMNRIVAFSNDEEVLLCDFLQKNNAVLGIRPHKFSKLQPLPLIEACGLLLNLEEYELTNTILKHTHTLITDYSSVWLDFSLISSNTCLYLFDEEEYGDERGMIYPLDEVLSGEITKNFEQLLISLNAMINRDENTVFEPSKLFFKYRDSANTKRFIEHVMDDNE